MPAIGDRRRLVGYTLDDVLANNKRSSPITRASARADDFQNRTLLDIIRDEEPGASRALFGHKDKRSWKSFRDKLRLKRAGSAWVSTVPIPTSDMPVHNKRYGKRNQVRFDTVSEATRTQIEESSKHGSSRPSSNESTHHDDPALVSTIRPSFSRHNSIRVSDEIEDFTDPTEPERDHRVRQSSTAMIEERRMSAREAVAAQEAADAAAAAEQQEEEEEENEEASEASMAAEPVRMSLMDLLQETDRELGLEGIMYAMGDEEEEEEEDEEYYSEESEEDEEEEEEEGEANCCVCMVRHGGVELIHCGHTFCRLCSKELMISHGNCPTCNGYISEILYVF